MGTAFQILAVGKNGLLLLYHLRPNRKEVLIKKNHPLRKTDLKTPIYINLIIEVSISIIEAGFRYPANIALKVYSR